MVRSSDGIETVSFGTFEASPLPRRVVSRRAAALAAVAALSMLAVISVAVITVTEPAPTELESLPALQARLSQMEHSLQFMSGQAALEQAEAANRLELQLRARYTKAQLAQPQVMNPPQQLALQAAPQELAAGPEQGAVEEFEPVGYAQDGQVLYEPVLVRAGEQPQQPILMRQPSVMRQRPVAFKEPAFAQNLDAVAGATTAAAAAANAGVTTTAAAAPAAGATTAAAGGYQPTTAPAGETTAAAGTAAGATAAAAGATTAAAGASNAGGPTTAGATTLSAEDIAIAEYNVLNHAADSQKSIYEMADSQANSLDDRGESLMHEGAALILGGYEKKQEGTALINQAVEQRKAAAVARLSYEHDVAAMNANRAKRVMDFDSKYSAQFASEAQQAAQNAANNLAAAQIAEADQAAALAAVATTTAVVPIGDTTAAGGSAADATTAAAAPAGATTAPAEATTAAGVTTAAAAAAAAGATTAAAAAAAAAGATTAPAA